MLVSFTFYCVTLNPLTAGSISEVCLRHPDLYIMSFVIKRIKLQVYIGSMVIDFMDKVVDEILLFRNSILKKILLQQLNRLIQYCLF